LAWEARRNPKLAVGILLGSDMIYKDMLKAALALWREPGTLFLFETRKYDVALSRNIIAAQALKEGVDWLLFWDADIVPPANTIPRLLSHNVPMVSALYWRRHPNMEPCAYKLGPEGIPVPYTDEELGRSIDQLLEVEAVGMGCCLIHVPLILEKLKPYCEEFTLTDPESRQTLRCWRFFESIVKTNVTLSEDIVFCSKVRRLLNGKIFLDVGLQCGHLTSAMVKYGRMNWTPLTLGREV
jgi:hypothetical protein